MMTRNVLRYVATLCKLATCVAVIVCIFPALVFSQGIAGSRPQGCMQTQIHGFVISSGRRVQQKMIVTLDSPFGGDTEQTFTDENGNFSFDHIEPAVYTVTVKGAGYEDASSNVDIRISCFAYVQLAIKPLQTSTEQANSSPGPLQTVDAQAANVPREDLKKGIELLAQANKPEQSLPYFQNVVEKAPKYVAGHVLLGTAFLHLGRWAEAEKSFATAVSLNPDLAIAQHSLGLALKQQGKFQEAEPHLLRAAKLDGKDPACHFDLAVVYVSLDRPRDAEAQAKSVLQLEPNFADVHYLLGNIKLQEKNAGAALGEFQTYLRLQPIGPLAVNAQAMVDKIQQAISSAKAGASH